jgi:hypothetical protein
MKATELEHMDVSGCRYASLRIGSLAGRNCGRQNKCKRQLLSSCGAITGSRFRRSRIKEEIEWENVRGGGIT